MRVIGLTFKGMVPCAVAGVVVTAARISLEEVLGSIASRVALNAWPRIRVTCAERQTAHLLRGCIQSNLDSRPMSVQ